MRNISRSGDLEQQHTNIAERRSTGGGDMRNISRSSDLERPHANIAERRYTGGLDVQHISRSCDLEVQDAKDAFHDTFVAKCNGNPE